MEHHAIVAAMHEYAAQRCPRLVEALQSYAAEEKIDLPHSLAAARSSLGATGPASDSAPLLAIALSGGGARACLPVMRHLRRRSRPRASGRAAVS